MNKTGLIVIFSGLIAIGSSISAVLVRLGHYYLSWQIDDVGEDDVVPLTKLGELDAIGSMSVTLSLITIISVLVGIAGILMHKSE